MLRVAVWHALTGAVAAPPPFAAWRAQGLDTVALQDFGEDETPCGAFSVLLFWCPQRLTEHPRALHRCRARHPLTPLAVAIDCAEDIDHLLAVESGADDVIDVAWSSVATAARLRSLQRHRRSTDASAATQTLQYGRLELCRPGRQVRIDGRRVAITGCEFELLWLLASHPGVVFDRALLLLHLNAADRSAGRRAIDTRVYRLRMKLGHGGQPAEGLRSVRGAGYLFVAEGW